MINSKLIRAARLDRELYVGLVEWTDSYTVRLYGDPDCLFGLLGQGLSFDNLDDAWEFFDNYYYQERGTVLGGAECR